MALPIGTAPCSWGVEFPDSPANPPWERVLDETHAVGYRGIELGPVGYMPEDPARLGDALGRRDLVLIGGVVFRPFHDPEQWDEVLDGVHRTCKALNAHGAERLVFIDSISPRRADYAGRVDDAPRMEGEELNAFLGRVGTAAKICVEEYGLTPSLHAHAAGFIEFEDELEQALDAIDERLMKVCLDTGHSVYAGFDPIEFYKRHFGRVDYLHFKDIDPTVRNKVVGDQVGFYDACAQGVFCNLGKGAVDFPDLKRLVEEKGFNGWATIEQDCDPALPGTPIEDAKANRTYLESIGF